MEADLVAGMLDAGQAGYNCLPGKQLLHDLELGILDGWTHVDQLVGDAKLMYQGLEVNKLLLLTPNHKYKQAH